MSDLKSLLRQFFTHLFIVVSLVGGVQATRRGSTVSNRPNVILIMLDDMGFSDISCYGGEIPTPHIDQLAENGLRFKNFYNASKCEPSRASLLSGLYWNQSGLGIKRGLTMGQVMQSAGYTTMAVGKWHVDGNPVDRGFDRAFGHLSGATNYYKGDKTFHLDGQSFKVPKSNFYVTQANTDYALQFIDDHRQAAPDKPFFLYLAYNAPHGPLQALPEDIKKHRGQYLAGWDQLRRERFERQQALGLMQPDWPLPERPGHIPAWSSLTPKQQAAEDERMAVYAAMIDRVDQGVGQIMAQLENWGMAQNTLVLFLSDNGGNPFDRGRKGTVGTSSSSWNCGVAWAHLSNTPFRFYKRNQHEGGVATPLVAHWPARIQKPGTWIDEPGHIIDLMATLVDLGQASYPSTYQGQAVPPLPGKSLVPLLEGKTREAHEALFFALFDHRAVIANGWKLASAYGSPWELYNLAEDRAETLNLAAQYPQKVNELEALFTAWWGGPYTGKAKSNGPPAFNPVLEAETGRR